MRLSRVQGHDDRRSIVAFATISVLMLAGTVTMRITAPSPYAPRVYIRWADSVTEAQRTTIERDFALLAGQWREGTTWEYDLAEPSRTTIDGLVDSPTVADTHFIDRGSRRVAADAPRGTTRLDQAGLVGWIHSPVFDWLIAFGVSSSIVSSVQLASAGTPQHR